MATLYCSDRCRQARNLERDRDAMRVLADELRRRLGLSDGRGPFLTRFELEHAVRQLERLQGNHFEGLYHLPLSRKANGWYRPRRRGSTTRAIR